MIPSSFLGFESCEFRKVSDKSIDRACNLSESEQLMQYNVSHGYNTIIGRISIMSMPCVSAMLSGRYLILYFRLI